MKNIRADLQGGLGNQCFIYATARALSERPLLNLDYLAEDWVYKRKLTIDKFGCQFDIAPFSWRPIRLFKRYRYALLRKLMGRIGNGRGRLLRLGDWVAELPPFQFFDLDSLFVNKSSLTLDGYWQSEKYFYKIREQLVKEFQLKDNSWINDDQYMRQIAQNDNYNAFLHIRSYKEVPGKEDGRLAFKMVEFYDRAIDYLSKKVGVNRFYIFSDDMRIARQVLAKLNEQTLKNLTCVFVEGGNQIQDFMRMRKCKHGIVADSSYSWWAGWLGEQERLLRGEKPIRIRVNRRVMNDDFWPERWIAL